MSFASAPVGAAAPPDGPAPLPNDNELVIGEGVRLDLEAASLAIRIAGALIDVVVIGAVLIISGIALSLILVQADGALAGAVVLVWLVGLLVVGPAALETGTRGRSLGKLAFNLRVVRDDGGPIRARHATIRALVGFFELWMFMGSVAAICSLANPRGKRLGDLLAGTYVLRERSAYLPVVPILMPPALAGWAAGADIGRLPDELAMTVRTFLTRLPTLTPAARASLGTQLAEQLRPLVAPHPPPGTHPELFLAAVIAERRDRALRRYERERAATARLRQALTSHS